MKKKYIVINQFDGYFCSVGRVTVNKGAEFTITYDGRVYFLHSKNYLPYTATEEFIKNKQNYIEL